MKEYIPTFLVVFAIACFAVPLGVALYEPQQHFAEEHGILGPDVGVVGELIRLKADGTSVRWIVLPETTDTQSYGENNENLVVSFRSSGKYSIVASIYNSKNEHSLHKLEILISKTTPLDPEVVPDKPDNPEPVQPASEISQAITKWCRETQPNKQIASQLANNFLVVAVEIKDGKLNDSFDIVARTAELNSRLKLEGFDVVMAGIQSILTQLEESGELATPDRHEKLWRMFALGLLEYANEK